MRVFLVLSLVLVLGEAYFLKRHRRGNEYHSWLTEEQKAELDKLKETASLEEQKDKMMEFYNSLPEEKQKELDEHYKKECVSWIKKVATDEEIAELKVLYKEDSQKEILTKVEEYKNRLDADSRKMVDVWAKECKELWFEKKETRMRRTLHSRKRKDINALIEKHLSWMEDGQKEEIRAMKAEGKSNEEIKKKILGYLQQLDGTAKEKTKKQITDDCYAWLKKAASQEEIDALHKMHEVDHDKCKKTVREYIKRLPQSEQDDVNRGLPFCEKIWYGDHDHSHHGHHHHHKRELKSAQHVQHKDRFDEKKVEEMLKQNFDWLSEEQMRQLQKVKYDKREMQETLLSYFRSASSQVKRKAIETIKAGCVQMLGDAIGETKMEELRKLRMEGGSDQEISDKVAQFLNEAPEGKAKNLMIESAESCKRAFLWRP